MTFLDVLDDAVKIGLGSLSGWLIFRSTRSHEFEKERRRRKQDCLERVTEDLGELESTFASWVSYSLGARRLRDSNQTPAADYSLKIVVAKNDNVEAAEAKLMRSHSKLIVFGFDECAAALQAYHAEFNKLRVLVHAVRDGTKEEKDFRSDRDENLAKFAQDFRKTVTDAFATL